jgi:hypothetical protein
VSPFPRPYPNVSSGSLLRLLSTDQDMIPDRNAADAHAQGFVVNEKLILPILKAFSQYTHSLNVTRNTWTFLVCVIVEQSVAPTNSNPLVPTIANSPPHRARHPPPMYHLTFCSLYTYGDTTMKPTYFFFFSFSSLLVKHYRLLWTLASNTSPHPLLSKPVTY